QERALARAVRTHEPDFFAALEHEARVRDQRPVADAQRELLRSHDLALALLHWRQLDARGLAFVGGLLDALELLELRAPALRLLGVLAREVAADEVFGARDVLLLLLERGELELALLGAHGHGARVAAGKDADARA